jgi:hypothetical protein
LRCGPAARPAPCPAAPIPAPLTPPPRPAPAPAPPPARSYAIHTRTRDADELKAAQSGLPKPWPTAAPGVYYTGWHSDASFGGAGWLITRPGRGNVLVDSPRFNPLLAKQIEKLGGVEYIFLTHK